MRVGIVRLVRRVFSFPAMIACLLALLACLTVRARFDDPDMWWHLKMGQVIWTTHAIPSTDLFSYTTNHHAYIAHEWLSQLTIYGAYRLGGYAGLMLWLYCCSAAVLMAGYALCTLYSGNAKVAFPGALAIWLFSTIGLSIRPQMIGYLLLEIELVLLHLGRTRDARWFYGLPPLFALWVNCHGSFFLGIAMASLLLFSAFFEFEAGSLVASKWEPQRRRTLAWALGLSVVALFANPVGVRLVLYPVQALLVPSVGLGAVSEWQQVQLDSAVGVALMGVVAVIALLAVTRKAELRWHELLWLALLTWLAASHRRLLFPFGIVSAPVVARMLAGLWDHYEAEKDLPAANATLMAAALAIAVWTFPSRANLEAQVERLSPVKAVAFIQSHQLAGPMLNEWLYGGYLLWAMPEHPVFIDGRGDIFEWAGVLQQYGRWAQFEDAPRKLPDQYGVQFCLLSSDSPMRKILPLIGWTSAYADGNSVVLVRAAQPATR